MAVVNALGLLENSPFKDASQFPLLEDPPVDTQANDQEEEFDDEGDDSPSMRELSKQINAHVVVLDEENQGSTIPADAQSIQPTNPSPTIPDAPTILETSTVDP